MFLDKQVFKKHLDNFLILVDFNQCCGAGAGAGAASSRIFWPEPDPEP
jgi:hypothetical protein